MDIKFFNNSNVQKLQTTVGSPDEISDMLENFKENNYVYHNVFFDSEYVYENSGISYELDDIGGNIEEAEDNDEDFDDYDVELKIVLTARKDIPKGTIIAIGSFDGGDYGAFEVDNFSCYNEKLDCYSDGEDNFLFAKEDIKIDTQIEFILDGYFCCFS